MKLFITVLIMLNLCSIIPAQTDTWIVGEWFLNDKNKTDKDDTAFDIEFYFSDDGTYHSLFYKNIETKEGLILEAKGFYTFSEGYKFNWERTHRWNGSEWNQSIKSGIFYIYRKGSMLELRTDKYIWLLEKRKK